MRVWISATLEHIARFFTKHSHIFKDENRNISQDALIKTAELYAIIQRMRDREDFDFIERDYMDGILKRVSWIFNQLLINYRINYKEYLQFEDDNNRFFRIDPTGKIQVNPVIYNIPKHFSDKGMYPDLGSGVWVKEYMIKEEEK